MDAPKPRLGVEAQPFLPYLAEEEVVERLGTTVEPHMKRLGFLPNAIKLYAHRPEIAETLFRLNGIIMRDPSSTLDPFLKRKLAAIACKTNGCSYCIAHSCSVLKRPRSAGAGAEGWGLSDADLHALLSDDYLPDDAFERACVEYVLAASSDPTHVPDSVLEELKRHLTPPQVIELACLVGFCKFFNTVHDSLHIPLEADLLPESGWVDA
jgi:alkylhydroperoxidase family enzyme